MRLLRSVSMGSVVCAKGKAFLKIRRAVDLFFFACILWRLQWSMPDLGNIGASPSTHASFSTQLFRIPR